MLNCDNCTSGKKIPGLFKFFYGLNLNRTCSETLICWRSSFTDCLLLLKLWLNSIYLANKISMAKYHEEEYNDLNFMCFPVLGSLTLFLTLIMPLSLFTNLLKVLMRIWFLTMKLFMIFASELRNSQIQAVTLMCWMNLKWFSGNQCHFIQMGNFLNMKYLYTSLWPNIY